MSTSPERLVEELSSRHRHIAVLAAHDVLADWALAEDAAQLAFLLILNRLRSGDRELLDRPEAAVRRNARWAALKIRDARLRTQIAEDRCGRGTPGDDAGAWSSAEARLVCEGILASLPAHYREAIQLRFFRQLPDADAAALLQVTLRAYRRRLDRALALARSVAGEIGLRGAAAILAALQGWRALRDQLRRIAGVGDVWGTPVATTTALVVIAVGPGVSAFAAAPFAAPRAAAHGGGAVAVAGATAHGGAGGVVMQAAGATPGGAVPAAVSAHHRITAADETPQDTTLYSVAATPGSDGRGAAVALGWGHGCTCTVLFESRDGWRTWRAAAGPDAALSPVTRLALPPAYPADPRILLGSPTVSTVPDMVAPGFDAAFSPLPFTGWITMPPSFETDGVFFVATAGGLERVSFAGADQTRPVVFVPPAMATVLSTAAAPGSAVTFVISGSASSVAMVGAQPVGAYSVDYTGGVPELYACTSDGHCSRLVASPASLVLGLAVSPSYATDHVLAVYGTQRDVHLSTDSGASFTTLPDPGGPLAWAAPATANGTVVVWALVAAGSGAWAVMQWDSASGWRTVSPPSWRPSAAAMVQALLLGADGAVIFPAGAPPLCTADGGSTWGSVCPA